MALNFLEEAGWNLLPKLIPGRPRIFAGMPVAQKMACSFLEQPDGLNCCVVLQWK